MSTGLQRRIAALEQVGRKDGVYAVVFVGAGETAAQATVRTFPEGVPPNRRLMVVSWMTEAMVADPGHRPARFDGRKRDFSEVAELLIGA